MEHERMCVRALTDLQLPQPSHALRRFRIVPVQPVNVVHGELPQVGAKGQ